MNPRTLHSARLGATGTCSHAALSVACQPETCTTLGFAYFAS
jgi:hypothetical protein